MAAENSNESPDLTLLGRYRIVSKIGAGGMGDVYLAEDTRLHRKIAVKILIGTRALLALVLVNDSRPEEALALALREPDEFWRRWSLAILHYAAGRKAESNEMIRELTKEPDGNAYQIAEIYSMRDEKNKAFDWLERAYQERDSGITHTKVNPRFCPLHGDSRWTAMLRKIGFDL